MSAAQAEPRRLRMRFFRRWKRRLPRRRAAFRARTVYGFQREWLERDCMRRMCGWLMSAVLTVGVLGGLAGCKSNDAGRQSEATEKAARRAPAAPLDPAMLGMVSGTIQLAGKPPA